MSAAGGRLRLLLGSAGVAALLLGSGTPPALAACTINIVGNPAAGAVNNTTNSINCINIQNSTVNGGSGNVANTSPGVIITTSAASPTGIRINNSTLTGAVINTGTITAATGVAEGIVVANGALVAGGITNSGAISGLNDILVGNVGSFGGGIVNGVGGVLTGQDNGIVVGSTISHSAGGAVSRFTGGITNAGTIVASRTAIVVDNVSTFTGGITNSGTITSSPPSNGIVVAAVKTFAGGITNIGAIAVSRVGISLSAVTAFSGTLSNAGNISGATGIKISGSTLSGAIIDSGNILAFNGIVIDSASKVAVATGTAVAVTAGTFAGSISNAGTLSAPGVGILVDHVAVFTSGIVNSGLIDPKTGIAVTNTTSFAGGITNASGGTINATAIGIKVGGVPTFVGNVSNAGIISGSTGIRISGSTIFGQIIDSGTLLATSHGLFIDSASKINSTATAVVISAPTFTGGVSNAGTISTSGASGIFVVGTTTFTGGIANSGNIQARTHALTVNAVSTFAGGITNSGSGLLAGNNAVLLVSNVAVFGTNAAGGITNIGTITGQTAEGIYVTRVGAFTGNISNAGTIAAPIAIRVEGSTLAGAIIAGGDILASVRGIRVDGASKVTAATGAAIAVTGATLTGGVSNAGSLSAAAGSGIAVVGVTTFGGGIVNAGTISAGGIGIAVSGVSRFTGGIANLGLIDPKTGIAVTNTVSFAGGITNASGATINATAIGIKVGGVPTFVGNVSNAGTITGPTGIRIAGSTIFGQIVDSGTLLATSHGILVDSASKVTTTQTTIKVNTAGAFTGGISNAGTLSTARDGVLVGSNVTSFSGGIANSGTISASAVGVAVSGAFLSPIATFAGGIANTGTISAANTGVKVAFVSSFSGGVTNGGTISAGSPGIVVLSVSTFTAGNVSNFGAITAHTGIAIGAGVTFAAGGAIVNSGNIAGSVAAIDVSTATSPVTIDQTAGTLTGAIKLSTNADVLNVSGGVINGNILGAGATNTINFALGAGTFTYANSFAGINQVNVNSGTVILNGADSASHTDVNGGTLAGTGTLTSPLVVHSGGTFAPGTPGSPGTSMSIVGTLTFQPGATYRVYLNPSAATSATVSGAVSLAGTVQANFAPGTYVSRSYDILHSGGLGGTTFSGLTTIPPNFVAALSYTTTDVLLNLTAGLGQTGGLTANQQNVATTLNAFFNNGGALPPGFAAVFGLGGASLANAFNQLDGEVATGAERAAFQIESQFLSLLLDPFGSGRGDGVAGAGMLGFAPDQQASLPPAVALAYASVLKARPLPVSFEPRWTAWGSVYRGQASANGDPVVVGSTHVTTGTFGFAGGMDYRLSPDTVVGFGLGGGGTGWGLAQGQGSGRSDTLQAGVYGTTHRGPAYVAAALAFAEHWMSTSRTALGDQLTADFDGRSVGARLEAGWRVPLMLDTMALGVAPYAAVQTQWFHTPTYSERDLMPAGFGLTYQAMTANDTRGELGLRVDDLATLGGMPLLLRGRLAWAHDWVDNPALSAVFQALPGTNFVVFGAPVAHDAALASAGAELRITPRLDLTARFDGELAAGAQTYAGSGTLRYRW